MIPQTTARFHTLESISPDSQQTVAASRTNTLSVADLFGLGLVLIIVVLVGRQLTIHLYRSYRLHRLVVSLQHRATLERQLYRKSLPALQKSPSRRT
jgi:hypothetical protein